MAKFIPEEKSDAVLGYLKGKENLHEIAKSIGVGHMAILKWAKPYEFYCMEALINNIQVTLNRLN